MRREYYSRVYGMGILALGLGITILILQYPLQEIGFALLSATSDVKASGQAYYDARFGPHQRLY
jgi:hypothetical protein